MTQPAQPPNNVVSTAPATVTPGPPLLSQEEREYYLMRWRALMIELRFIADRMGWADRLPSKRI